MGSVVIVGIPTENDRVWKVSSEKVPHITILFLGEEERINNLDQIIQFVEHAGSTALDRFYLPVDKRGKLGDAEADVLFFRKGWYTKGIRDFRSMLLKDPNIKTAYDTTSQFETPPNVGAPGQPWIPHLTLGYPASPAKPEPDDHGGFWDVSFDRLAVWVGDYEGPEFELRDSFDDMMTEIPMDVAMSDIHHYGTKGMRWGVRKQELADGGHIRISNKTNVAAVSNASLTGIVGVALVVPGIGGLGSFLHPRVRREWKAANTHNKLVRGDKKWKKQLDKSKKGIEVHNAAADEINSKLGGFNNDKRWKDASGKDIDLTKDSTKQKEYDDAVTKEVINPAYSNAAVKVYGSKSPSARYTFEVHDAAKGELKVTDALAERRKAQLAGVQHAATDEDRLEGDFIVPMTISRTSDGHILGYKVDIDPELENLEVEHSSDLGAEFLEHFGVKGMRWGVRKEDVASVARTVGEAAGKAAVSTGKFASDVAFEVHTEPGRDAEGKETRSRAAGIVARAAEKEFRSTDLPAINSKPEHVKASKLKNRLLHPLDKGTRAYRKEVRESYIQRLETTANSMKNASGNREYTIRERGGDLPRSKYGWEVSSRIARHAADDGEDTIFLEVLMDEDGFITGTKEVKDESSLAQSMDLGSALIVDLMEDAGFEHYGVKGMRWGQRREQFVTRAHQRELAKEGKTQERRLPSDVRATPTIGSSRRKKSEVKTKGGQDHPPTEDAIKVAAAKQKLKKSGVAALSNKELQEMERRLNLEVSVTRLAGGKRTLGEKFVDGLLGRGDKNDRKELSNQLGNQARDAAARAATQRIKNR